MVCYTDVNSAIQAEYELPEGTYQIRFYLSAPISQQELSVVKETLSESGLDIRGINTGIEDGVPYLAVTYNRTIHNGISFLPVAIIPLIGLGLIAGVIAFGIVEAEKVGTLLLIGGGVLIVLVALLRRPAEKYIEARR